MPRERSSEAGENEGFYQKAKSMPKNEESGHLKNKLDQRSVENKAVVVW